MIAEETLFPSLLHDVFVFIVQMIDDDIEDDTDDFCVKALVRAREASIEENAAVFCCYILEDLVAAIQLVQVFEEGELIFIFQELASDLDADDGVDGIVITTLSAVVRIFLHWLPNRQPYQNRILILRSDTIALPAPERCSTRVWDFPTSILQRKKCFCIDENIACWHCVPENSRFNLHE